MSKWELIEEMREYGFSDSDIVDMFTYWLDAREIEECVEDYLNDRDLKITERGIK